jgi:hypothetical protein
MGSDPLRGARFVKASKISVLRYFEWVPFDPRGIRGEVNNLELRKAGRE